MYVLDAPATIFVAVLSDANACQFWTPAEVLSTQVAPESFEVYIYPPLDPATIFLATLSAVSAPQLRDGDDAEAGPEGK